MSTKSATHTGGRGGHAGSGNTGYKTILDRANPSESWQRVASWCNRARLEGVVKID